MQLITQPPGIYYGVPFADYIRWKGANNSLLSILADGTPAHVKYAMDTGDGDDKTPAMELGLVVHKLLLEPGLAGDEIAIRPPEIKVRRGAKWDAFLAANQGKLIVKDEVAEKAVTMISNLAAHPIGGQLFRRGEGQSEASIAWIDEATGEPCKARTDRIVPLNEEVVVADLKTADDASRPAMERAVNNFAYHSQAAHTLAGLQVLAPLPAPQRRRWLLVVLETRPPYLPAIYELEDGALEVGESDRSKWLAIWAQCRKTGVWPGYGNGIGYVGLPAWRMRVFDAATS